MIALEDVTTYVSPVASPVARPIARPVTSSPVPAAEPRMSSLLRMIPNERMCYGTFRAVKNGVEAFCTVGHMMRFVGEDPTSPRRNFVMHTHYGLLPCQTEQLAKTHDLHGRDAAADLLASWGK